MFYTGEKSLVFDKFYSLQTKNEQDIFPQDFIEATEVSQRRPRKDNAIKSNASFILYTFYFYYLQTIYY